VNCEEERRRGEAVRLGEDSVLDVELAVAEVAVESLERANRQVEAVLRVT